MFSFTFRSVTAGTLFHELLDRDVPAVPHAGLAKMNHETDVPDTEGRAVDLVLGNDITDKEFKVPAQGFTNIVFSCTYLL